MKILFAALENAWGGFFQKLKAQLPQHVYEATGSFNVTDLEGVDVLIPTMTPITEEILAKSNQLKLIQQCGSGLELIDIKAAKRHGIKVANVPTDISGNADSVAELGIYLMIGLSRNYLQMAQSFKHQKLGQPQGMALRGKTVGLIGLGGIGCSLVKRLKPFGVKIIGIKQNNLQRAKQQLGLDWVGKPKELEFLLHQSDYVILCLPHTTKSHYLINKSSLSKMKPSAYLINLSRGGLIEYDALKDALSNKKIAGAGLDVFWQEPPDPNDEIFDYNVMATPHIAGSTDVSISGIVEGVTQNILRLEKRQPLLNTKHPDHFED
ncbi:MAG: lactate dehydrogenase [Proteobacteria bacterium]|nr:lactate dehydrogenase [Pseudomonadota bacterium]